MTIVSTTDTPEQSAAALTAHGYEVIETAAPPSDAPPVEQAAPPAEESTTDPAPEAGTQEQAPPGEPPKKKKASAQERIDELTREKYELKGQSDAEKRNLQAQIDQLKAQIEGRPATPPPAAEPELKKPERPKMPRQSQFDTAEEYETASETYETAMAAYEDQLADFNRKTAVKEFQAEEQQRQARAQMEAIHDAGRAAHPDYDAVVFNDQIQVTGAILDAIAESDDPQELYYWYSSHPEEAAAFVKATTYTDPRHALAANRNAARAVLQMQAAIAGTAAPAAPGAPAPAAPPAAPVPRQTTQTPAPARPLRGASGTPAAPDPNRQIGQNGWTVAKERALMANNGHGRR
jgi:hypothetical protein